MVGTTDEGALVDTSSVSHNSALLPLPVEDAFDLLCDATRYPHWLVGAQAITRVDAAWPAVGSRFEHRIGAGPFALPGSTTVRELQPPHKLALGAGMGVLGEAFVRFELRPAANGDETIVELVEVPRKGVAAAAARALGPLLRKALWGRNALSLGHLVELVERERRSPGGDDAHGGDDDLGPEAPGGGSAG